jgi:glycosyltransferase involved in cell wall biosynthesis
MSGGAIRIEADIVVLFSTFNGARTLPAMLEGYARAKAPDCSWRILVADNGSTDATPEILAGFADRLPLSVFRHALPGKNGALNAALDRAAAELYVLTDDDALPEADFMTVWARHRHDNAHDLFGGRVRLCFPEATPDSLREGIHHHPELYALNSRDAGPIGAEDIFGPNMAVTRRVFDAGFRFDTDIGPNSGIANYAMGSETEFCHRVEREGGYRALFVADAVVFHLIRPEQVTPAFFAGRAFRHGRGFAQRARLRGETLDWLDRSLRRRIEIWARSQLGGPFSDSRWQYHWTRGAIDTIGREQ